jgi:hypothetical protein
MPRYTLRLPKAAADAAAGDAPPDLRSDPRVTVIAEMPRMLLIDCPADVAEDWAGRMPGWTLQEERRAKVPDPRPKLK